jgi:hypothetical protein
MAPKSPWQGSDDHDLIYVPNLGFIAYSWLEREAICLESGLTETEALRVASRDYQREMSQQIVKTYPRMGLYPNSYGPSLRRKGG